MHRGSTATTRYYFVLLETGSPQSFITVAAVKQLKDPVPPRTRAYDTPLPVHGEDLALQLPPTTSDSVRLSTQVMHSDSTTTTPTAALAVTMQHPLFLGRDS